MSPYAVRNVVAPSFNSLIRGRLVKLVEPAELSGTYVLVDVDACANSVYSNVWCMQTVEHRGPCWNCSEELYMQTKGSWAKLVTDP